METSPADGSGLLQQKAMALQKKAAARQHSGGHLSSTPQAGESLGGKERDILVPWCNCCCLLAYRSTSPLSLRSVVKTTLSVDFFRVVLAGIRIHARSLVELGD